MSEPLRPAALIPPPADAPPLWRRVLPWVFGVALVGFLLTHADLGRVWRSLRAVNPAAYFAFVAASCVATLLTDTLGTWRVYRIVTPALSPGALLAVRGASYLPTTLNYHMGQAYLTYLLARSYRTPLARVAGATLLIYATLLSDLVIVAAAALPLAPPGRPWIARGVLPLAAGVGAYLLLLWARPAIVTRYEVLRPLFEGGPKRHLTLMLWRLPHVAVLGLSLWLAYRFFGVAVPARAALVHVPVLLLASAVPLTPQGAGTRDIVALELLTEYVAAPAGEQAAPIVAAGSAWVIATALAQCLIGLACSRAAATALRGPGGHNAGATGDGGSGPPAA